MLKNGQERHQQLKKLIATFDHQYHVLDSPSISDYEYDQLFAELLDLESRVPGLDLSDSPSQRAGATPLETFEKVPHRLPMLSLANSYSPEDILAFDQRVRKHLVAPDQEIEYLCEPKFDGLAIELVYENGTLIRALTRGDGTTGENVTANIKTIRSIPLRLTLKTPPALLEVRGEVLMLKEDFKSLNRQQEENGLATFANPRNAAAGTIRQLDSKVVAARPLSFFAYALGATEGVTFETQDEVERYFAKAGLPTIEKIQHTLKTVCLGSEALVAFYHDIETLRGDLPFDIDGIVIKVNLLRLQNELGIVARSPRWATAAKYKPEQAETVITDIQVQVGRTGALTPVAIMKPVRVGGVTITNATLHNQEEVSRKDVRIGDTVLIQRAGDVIPEVVSVVLAKRPADSIPYRLPHHCPSCGEPSSKLEEEVVSRCLNPHCPAVLKESLKHFVSRRALNVDKVGDKLIEALVDKGLVKNFSDIYALTAKSILENLERQGEKSTENILKSIEDSRRISLARFIYGLGIRFVGEQTAKALAEHFVTIDNFVAADDQALLSISDVGPKVASSILSYLKNPKTVKEIQRLSRELEIQSPARSFAGALSGKSFLITGTLPLKRDEAKDLIEAAGGKVVSAVSAKLDFLVVGDEPGSKVEKAQNLGVTIIDWDQLQRMMK